MRSLDGKLNGFEQRTACSLKNSLNLLSMVTRLFLVFMSAILIGCGQRRSAPLTPIPKDYLPFDSQVFADHGMAPAVSVAKAEFEKRQGKATEARYLFATTRTNYYVFILPVLGYDHGQPLTDTNRECGVEVTEQLRIVGFYSRP